MSRTFMTLDALSRTPEFQALTVRQQLWMQTYAASSRDLGAPDLRLATKVAFDFDPDSERQNAYTIVRKKKIQAAIRVWRHYEMTEKEIALEDVRADIAASKPGSPARAKFRALELKLIGAQLKRKTK